jgi:hypothetical protein
VKSPVPKITYPNGKIYGMVENLGEMNGESRGIRGKAMAEIAVNTSHPLTLQANKEMVCLPVFA